MAQIVSWRIGIYNAENGFFGGLIFVSPTGNYVSKPCSPMTVQLNYSWMPARVLTDVMNMPWSQSVRLGPIMRPSLRNASNKIWTESGSSCKKNWVSSSSSSWPPGLGSLFCHDEGTLWNASVVRNVSWHGSIWCFRINTARLDSGSKEASSIDTSLFLYLKLHGLFGHCWMASCVVVKETLTGSEGLQKHKSTSGENWTCLPRPHVGFDSLTVELVFWVLSSFHDNSNAASSASHSVTNHDSWHALCPHFKMIGWIGCPWQVYFSVTACRAGQKAAFPSLQTVAWLMQSQVVIQLVFQLPQRKKVQIQDLHLFFVFCWSSPPRSPLLRQMLVVRPVGQTWSLGSLEEPPPWCPCLLLRIPRSSLLLHPHLQLDLPVRSWIPRTLWPHVAVLVWQPRCDLITPSPLFENLRCVSATSWLPPPRNSSNVYAGCVLPIWRNPKLPVHWSNRLLQCTVFVLHLASFNVVFWTMAFTSGSCSVGDFFKALINSFNMMPSSDVGGGSVGGGSGARPVALFNDGVQGGSGGIIVPAGVAGVFPFPFSWPISWAFPFCGICCWWPFNCSFFFALPRPLPRPCRGDFGCCHSSFVPFGVLGVWLPSWYWFQSQLELLACCEYCCCEYFCCLDGGT